MRITSPLCLAVLVCCIFYLPAIAAPGDLDLTFGGAGKVTTAIGNGEDRGFAVAVQSDGKVVVAGSSWSGTDSDFALVRYNAEGTLDTSFGSGGKVTTAITGSDEFGTSIAVQSDGKIVIAGYSWSSSGCVFALARYNDDGSLDMSFGSGGTVTTAIGNGAFGRSDDRSYSIAVQGDGKIVVSGSSSSPTGYVFALARYNADGTLDSSFGSSGKVTTTIGSVAVRNSDDCGYSVAVQSDGKIVVAGSSYNGTYYKGTYFSALARYNADGSVDTSFGGGGWILSGTVDRSHQGYAAAIQSDGKIVVAGSSNFDTMVVRYNANGSLDSGFGSGGKVTTAVGSNPSYYGRSVAVLGDGKIVVAGRSWNNSNSDFALVRYNADGSLDTSFGSGGKMTGSATGYHGCSVAVQGGEKIVVAGYADTDGSNSVFALARYQSVSSNPIVTTGSASEITASSARLSGSVNPDGMQTNVVFETAQGQEPYTNAGTVTADQSPMSDRAGRSVGATITGLVPRTTYRFRVIASNSLGTSVGTEVTFTTASAPVANDKTIHPNGIGSTQTIFSSVTDASDADGDPLSVAVLSYSGTGSVQVVDGVVKYTGGLLDGTEAVTVEVSDGFGGSDQATITLSNAAPLIAADSVSTPYGRVLAVPVLTNDTDADGDTLGVVSFTQPSHGRAIRAGTDPNMLVYIPQLGFSGVDTFTYTASDGRSAAVTGTVEITVGVRPNPSSSVALDTETPVPGGGEEGSGIPSGATWRIFGAPAINEAGQMAVLGTWKSPEGSGSGIFVDEQLVVKTGDPVPGLASVTFKSFTDPVLNGAGHVAFLATITGPGARKNNDTVLATNAFSGELELVAREGDLAAETGDAKFGKFYSISLLGDSSDNAGLLFTASLLKGSGSPKVKPTNDLGAWLRTSSPEAALRKVVREGDPGFAEGEKIKSFQLLQALRSSPGQGRGQYKADEVSFTVTLTSKRQAMVRFRAGVLGEEALTGELLGEALPEAKWKSFGLPATDGIGMVSAVRASLQNGLGGVTKANATGIFVSIGTGGTYAPVVRVGDEPFGVAGAVFSALSDPLVSGWNPGVAFLGSIRGPGVRGNNNAGIWWETLSGSSLVARAGLQATEAPEGARWTSFSSLALPDSERGPLFVGTLAKGAGSENSSNDTGLWAMDSVGEVRLLARERDPVGEKTLKSFSALQAVSGSAGVRRSFNNAGQVVYRAYFTDGSQGVVKVQVP